MSRVQQPNPHPYKYTYMCTDMVPQCTLRWGNVNHALMFSQWWWIGLDVVDLHEGGQLVRYLCQCFLSLKEK